MYTVAARRAARVAGGAAPAPLRCSRRTCGSTRRRRSPTAGRRRSARSSSSCVARGAARRAWMFAARLCGRKFQEIIGDDDEALRKRLEMMTQIYFVKAVRRDGWRRLPAAQTGAGAPQPHGAAAALLPARLNRDGTGRTSWRGRLARSRPSPRGGHRPSRGGREWEQPRNVCRPNCVAFVNNQPPPKSGNDRGTCTFLFNTWQKRQFSRFPGNKTFRGGG